MVASFTVSVHMVCHQESHEEGIGKDKTGVKVSVKSNLILK